MGAVFNRNTGFLVGAGTHYGYDGDEQIAYFGIGGNIWANGGHDSVSGAMGYVNIYDTWGNLNVFGSFGYMSTTKSEWGDINVGAAIGYADIRHLGSSGNVNVWGANGGTSIFRSGNSGSINFWGAAAGVNLQSSVNWGDINIGGVAGSVNASHYGFLGDINIYTAAIATSIHHYAVLGNVNYYGAGFANIVNRKGFSGDVNYFGIGGFNKITHEVNQGYVRFYGAGMGNYINSTINGDGGVLFFGAGGANVIRVAGSGRGMVNFYGIGNANIIAHSGSYGDVNYYGAGGANIVNRTGGGGNVNFYGIGSVNIITHSGRYGDVNYYGAGGANIVQRTGGSGNVNFYGIGSANIITHSGRHGDVNYDGAGGLNIITRSGGIGNVFFKGIGAGNIVTMTVESGDLLVTATGGANIFTRTGAGVTNAYLAGGSNVLTNNGSGFTSAKLYGAYNHVTTGSGGSDIESYGLGATIITGGGVDHIKSYGLFSVIRSGGASDGKQDHVEAYGAFTVVDLGQEDNGARGKLSADRNFKQVTSSKAVQTALLGVRGITQNSDVSISSADSAAMRKHGISDEALLASNESKFSEIIPKPDGKQDGTVDQSEELAQLGLSVDESRLNPSEAPNADSYKQYVQTDSGGRNSVTGIEGASAQGVQEKLISSPYASGRMSGEGDFRNEATVTNGTAPSETMPTDRKKAKLDEIGGNASGYDSKVELFGVAVNASTGNNNDILYTFALLNIIRTNGGDDYVIAGGACNLIYTGSGNDSAVVFGIGNYADMGSGDDVAVMLNLLVTTAIPSANVVEMGEGNDIVVAMSHVNVVLKHGDGSLKAFLFGLGNVLLQRGGKHGDQMLAVMAGILNVAHKEGNGDVTAIILGHANTVSQKGDGKFLAIMKGSLSIATQIGTGHYEAYMSGQASISTKVGDGFSRVVMLSFANVHTGIGDGDAQFYMVGTCNIATKIGNGRVSSVIGGMGNILTVVGDGDLEGVFIAGGNIITKIGDGNAAVITVAFLNVYNHVGNGNLTAITLGQGNITTKAGNGDVYLLSVAVPLSAFLKAPLVPTANLFTQTGDGNVMGVMVAVAQNIAGNIFTKIGDGDVALALITATPDSANIFSNDGRKPFTMNAVTQVGNGRTYALMFGGLNIFTKVGSGDYADGWDKWDDSKAESMFDNANSSIANTVNDWTRTRAKDMSPLLANPNFNTIMGAFGSANVMVEVNHKSALNEFDNTEAIANIIGKKTTNTIMAGVGGYGNVMVKVGDGGFYGFAVANPAGISKYFSKHSEFSAFIFEVFEFRFEFATPSMVNSNSNIIVHVGHGDTNALAIGSANVIFKVGNGGYKAISIGDNNVILRVGDAAGTKQAVDIAGYRAFEGAQFVFGDRNMVVNQGRSNDMIVALDPNMLLDGAAWKKIADSMNTTVSSSQSDKDGKEISDIFGRKFNSKTDPQGYSKAESDNINGPLLAGIATLLKGGYSGIYKDLEKKRIEDNEKAKEKGVDSPDPYGNFVYGGEGSDIIFAIGTNNIVFSDSWTSLADFNAEMVFDSGGTNKTLSALGAKLGTFGSLLDSRSIGLDSIPVIGPILSKLGVKAAFEWPRRMEVGSLTGLDGDADGTAQFDSSDVGQNWTKFALGAPQVILETPRFYTSVVGQVVNMSKMNTEFLSHKGEGFTNEQKTGLLQGWKGAGTEFISVLGFPELVSSLDERDAKGRTVWGRFFDRSSSVGWGSMWKDPDSFWSGVNLLQDNSDIITAIGMNNIVFTGQGGDMSLTLGSYNSVALGSGRDISMSWGSDNRVNGGDDNDFLIGIGQKNLQIGGAGNDLVVAIGGNNRLSGDDGDDMIVAFGTKNVVLAGAGNDVVVAAGTDNVIYAGGGDDFIIAMGEHNVYNMAGGNDVILNIGFASQSYYGEGTDIAYARGIGDFLDGQKDSDLFYSDKQSKHNLICGSEGDDTFYLGGRDNRFNGGADNDTFVVRDHVERVTIEDQTNADRIVIDGSVKVKNIWLSRKGADLLMEIDLWDRVRDGSVPEIAIGEVSFINWFSSSSNTSNLYFEQEKTSSGEAVATAKIMRPDDLNALVDAMAGFTRADAFGSFRDNMDIATQRRVDSLWGSASKTDSFSVAKA